MIRRGETGAPFSVLLVCTGNICRSAFAERLARARLDEVLGGAAGSVRVQSAGTRAVVGSGMHPDSALALVGFGGDPAGFVARQLTVEMVTGADLTLTMTGAHRRTVLGIAPQVMSRSFLLREAADLVDLLGDDPGGSGGTLPDRARVMVGQLAAIRSRRTTGVTDDVADPIGKSLDVHEQMGEVVSDAVLRILARLAGSAPPVATTERPGRHELRGG